MTRLALLGIATDPPEVIEVFATDSPYIDLPDGHGRVSPLQAGWQGGGAVSYVEDDDGRTVAQIGPDRYRIVNVTEAAIPDGKVPTGDPAYAFDADTDTVIETLTLVYALSLDEMRAQAVAVLEEAIDTRVGELTSPRPAKRDRYMLKADIAARAIAGNEAAAAMLAEEAAARSMTAGALARLIAERAAEADGHTAALEAAEITGRTAITAAADREAVGTALDGALAIVAAIAQEAT